MIRLFISLVIVLVLASCSASDNKKGNNVSSEVVADYVQVDSPNSFIPLGIGITVAPPEHGQNAKYFIANKDVAEVNFDYMNNNYTYRASKNTNNLLSFYGDYINSGKNFTEEENNIVVEYNTTSNNEKFTLWRVDDIYYILSTQAEDDKDLTNLSSLYIKSIHWNKNK
ncbi:hypothetical protein WESB_0883 [Brachyspira pilosicoli WesB]|uniref:Lipoprotein n=1 Tax=Brachyspira pilosicoli WesB TaxID=1161918 RepID=K0JFF3_BRAPL|nr:hypothetical protein [Brachyspira pilosicoli]CCG56353.1 hypothetical protein WESB_0883 [Brachyspira pilosicoli WesB]